MVTETLIAGDRRHASGSRRAVEAIRGWFAMVGLGGDSQAVPRDDSEFRANDRRVQLPQWLLILLFVQGGGGIWWAATMQSDVRSLERENLKLWEKIETLGLQREKLMELMRDDVEDEVTEEVTDQLLSRGIIRVQPSP